MVRWSWTVLLVSLAGCWASPPEVTAVEPEVVMPGDTLVVRGVELPADVAVTLVSGAERVPLPVSVEDPAALDADIPDTLPPGRWVVEVAASGGPAVNQPAIVVWTADTEPPCTKRYALASEIVPGDAPVSVVRVFTDRPSTVLTVPAADLAGVTLTQDAGCSAIWVVRKDTTRVLYADDTGRDLAPHARALAEALKVPLATP